MLRSRKDPHSSSLSCVDLLVAGAGDQLQAFYQCQRTAAGGVCRKAEHTRIRVVLSDASESNSWARALVPGADLQDGASRRLLLALLPHSTTECQELALEGEHSFHLAALLHGHHLGRSAPRGASVAQAGAAGSTHRCRSTSACRQRSCELNVTADDLAGLREDLLVGARSPQWPRALRLRTDEHNSRAGFCWIFGWHLERGVAATADASCCGKLRCHDHCLRRLQRQVRCVRVCRSKRVLVHDMCHAKAPLAMLEGRLSGKAASCRRVILECLFVGRRSD